MSKKELLVLWIIGIYTVCIVILGMIYPERRFYYQPALPGPGGPEYIERREHPTEQIALRLILGWTIGGLFFITFRNTRKKREKKDLTSHI